MSEPTASPGSYGSFFPQLTPEFVARALHVTPTGNQSRQRSPYTFVTSDSRKVRPGCLFIALKGDKFDGHDYIEVAVNQGARGVLHRRHHVIRDPKDVGLFAVDDTLTAYRKLAAAWRREFTIPVIAVAGSVGKTTTKEMLAAILRGKWNSVLKTEGSQNGFVGIPMTLLELRPEHGAAVIEVGIDEPGTMEPHAQLVHPSVAVLSAIGAEHLEKLKDIPTVAREEGEMLRIVAQLGGIAVINMDDPWIRPHQQTLRVGKKLTFSLRTEDARDNGITGRLVDGNAAIRVTGMKFNGERYKLPLPGAHNASNLLAAIAVATAVGLTPDEITQGLATFQGAYGRSELVQLGKTPVVCDYYNANPTSMAAGIDVLASLTGRPRWACIADMLELGEKELDFHRELATPLMAHGIERVLLYGTRMKALEEELKKLNYTGKVEHFETHAALAERLTSEAKAGEPILIKGSRSMRMEEVWKILEPYARNHWA